ncbi:MAG TPA: aspartate/glutamate racemase family protein [Bosea sp. (in: a-proteobacteria)]|jgi:aspartate/glutamate racemase|uniref:aspartate/glutamate racemase family protein n=1 Tax=Bosea sp. (in: a-proteobacteria) TaxID=1871050 RepID=UPI002E125903|nr:aspartate/glutamate racemase family protein [Bosea sp. (in: a-proteobacteria)]
MAAAPRIVLYHATSVAIEPVLGAMARLWPSAEPVNLLDDSLPVDRAKDGVNLSEDLTERFVEFGRYAHRIGADGILVTCSAFGPAIERMAEALPIPVVKPNEAMFRQAIASGARIGMLATFAPALSTMCDEFDAFVSQARAAATLDTIVVADAIDLLRAGDADGHNRLVADRAPELGGHDAIMLAQFSTSHAADAVRAAVAVPVLTAPDAAVARMRELVSGG